MIGMIEEVAVDPQRTTTLVAAFYVGKVEPVAPGTGGIGLMFLEEEDVDDDVGARLVAHGFPRQAHRSEEIGHGINMLPRFRIALVE